MSINLDLYQAELRKWQLKNFPGDAHSPEWMVVGAAEEFGEFCHAMLKNHQKIREYKDLEVAKKAMADAYADLNVYLLQVLSYYDISPELALQVTFDHVLSRDWTKNSSTGTVESTLPNPTDI